MEPQGSALPIKLMAVVLLVLLGGTLGYYVIEEDWTLLEAFYMTAITITTVGFGETRELSDTGRIFTVGLIFMGLGTAAALAAQLARFVVEAQLQQFLKGGKMDRKIGQMMDHYVLCGFGQIGQTVARSLDAFGMPFVVIERSEEGCGKAASLGYATIQGNATSDTTLFKAGVKRANGIIALLHEDADNLFISLAARELNQDIMIVARANDPQVEKRMLRAGADQVVYPLRLGAEQIAHLVADHGEANPEVTASVTTGIGTMGTSLRIYEHYHDTPITIAQARRRTQARQVVKYQNSAGEEMLFPGEADMVEKGDRLLFLVEEADSGLRPRNETPPECIEWTQEFSVGVDEIDADHLKLFEIVNEFLLALHRGNERDILQRTFDQLLDYTAEHFRHEEEIFQRAGYPDREAHHEEHQRITSKVRELNREKNFVFTENIKEFLYAWLRDHILEWDTRFGVFMIQQRGK